MPKGWRVLLLSFHSLSPEVDRLTHLIVIEPFGACIDRVFQGLFALDLMECNSGLGSNVCGSLNLCITCVVTGHHSNATFTSLKDASWKSGTVTKHPLNGAEAGCVGQAVHGSVDLVHDEVPLVPR